MRYLILVLAVQFSSSHGDGHGDFYKKMAGFSNEKNETSRVIRNVTSVKKRSLNSKANGNILLVCKMLKGLSLRMDATAKQEEFKKDGYSYASIVIGFSEGNLAWSWNQLNAPWNETSFKSLTMVQNNPNMALGYSINKGLEGIRLHKKKKTAVYFKHVAPAMDGLVGTDGVYKMNCIDKTKETHSLKNPTFQI